MPEQPRSGQRRVQQRRGPVGSARSVDGNAEGCGIGITGERACSCGQVKGQRSEVRGFGAGGCGYPSTVTIGTSILLVAIGAILRYAVNVHSSAFNISTAGLILMIVGILGLILSLLYTAFWADRTRPRRDPYLDEHPTRRY